MHGVEFNSVCCKYFQPLGNFFIIMDIASHADVLRGSSCVPSAGTRGELLKTSKGFYY